MTKNKIAAVYFLQKGSLLPEGCVESIIETAIVGSKANFFFEFWTNIDTLDQATINSLTNSNIEVKDYNSLRAKEHQHPINAIIDIIKNFVQLGDEGDIAAYAAASDVLRIAIATSLKKDTLYIYYDCNDTFFGPDLLEQLRRLPQEFNQNPWGLAFEHTPGDLRNDRMIVRKINNPRFLNAFFLDYFQLVGEHYEKYKGCETEALKQSFITTITCFTSLFRMQGKLITPNRDLFSIDSSGRIVVLFRNHRHTSFSSKTNYLVDYQASSNAVNFATYITSERVAEKSCSWRQFNLYLDDPRLLEHSLERSVIYINPDKKQYRFLSVFRPFGAKLEVIAEFPKDINLDNIGNRLTDLDLKRKLSAHALQNDPAFDKPTPDDEMDDSDLTRGNTDIAVQREQQHNIPPSIATLCPSFFAQSAITAQRLLEAGIHPAPIGTDNPMQVSNSDAERELDDAPFVALKRKMMTKDS